MSAMDLVKTTEMLCLPVMPYAMLIEQQYGQFLLPPIEGIYKIGETTPCIKPGESYYTQIQSTRGLPDYKLITDFNVIKDHVFDANGKLIIPSHIMRNKEQFLSMTPTVPVSAIMLVENLIKSYISSLSEIPRYNMFPAKVNSYILQEYEYINEDGYLQKICGSLFKQINQFVRNDTWYIYFVKLNFLDIIIEKTIDYRIYDYQQRLEINDYAR